MFLGHVAVALVAKRAVPRVSLGWFVGAAQLADLVWPLMVLAGVEHLAVTPGAAGFLTLSFTDSRSLTACSPCSAGVLQRARRSGCGSRRTCRMVDPMVGPVDRRGPHDSRARVVL